MDSARCKEYFKRDLFAAGSGIELLEGRPGYAKASLSIEPRHLNGAGVLHGGAIFTLADFAFAVASNSHGQVALSINASISYMKALKTGKVFAEAKEISLSAKIGNYIVEITDESGARIAQMQGTVYRKKDVIPELAG